MTVDPLDNGLRQQHDSLFDSDRGALRPWALSAWFSTSKPTSPPLHCCRVASAVPTTTAVVPTLVSPTLLVYWSIHHVRQYGVPADANEV